MAKSAKETLAAIGIDLNSSIDGTVFKWKHALLLHKTGAYVIPNPTQQENIIKQAHALNDVFKMLGGFYITSWLRTPAYNASIGGATKSAHLEGLATDFVPPASLGIEASKKRITSTGIYPGRMEIDTDTWIHLDLKPGKDFYARGEPKK